MTWMLIFPVFSLAAALPTSKDYYMITRSLQPMNSSQIFAQPQRPPKINLLAWTRAGKPLPMPSEPYDRQKHFGDWIDDSRDNNCMNTRAKVLFSFSMKPVTFTNKFRCVIETGQWKDFYTGALFNRADQIQIDHFVPLKQAYITGAWRWDRKARCLYGNFLFNGINLLPVSGRENMSKGDRAPDAYMPPDQTAWCGYIRNWLTIKLIWNLVLTESEASAIAQIYKAKACRKEDFLMEESTLSSQRDLIRKNANYCDFNAPRPGSAMKLLGAVE